MASRCELLTIHEAQGAPSDCEHQMHPRCAIELIPDSEWKRQRSGIIIYPTSSSPSLSLTRLRGKKKKKNRETMGQWAVHGLWRIKNFSLLSSAAVVDVAIYSLSFDGRYPYIILIGKWYQNRAPMSYSLSLFQRDSSRFLFILRSLSIYLYTY